MHDYNKGRAKGRHGRIGCGPEWPAVFGFLSYFDWEDFECRHIWSALDISLFTNLKVCDGIFFFQVFAMTANCIVSLRTSAPHQYKTKLDTSLYTIAMKKKLWIILIGYQPVESTGTEKVTKHNTFLVMLISGQLWTENLIGDWCFQHCWYQKRISPLILWQYLLRGRRKPRSALYCTMQWLSVS